MMGTPSSHRLRWHGSRPVPTTFRIPTPPGSRECSAPHVPVACEVGGSRSLRVGGNGFLEHHFFLNS